VVFLVYIWLIFLLPNFSYHKIEKENMNTIESNENCTSLGDFFLSEIPGHFTRCKQMGVLKNHFSKYK